jgi:hypothetical protein
MKVRHAEFGGYTIRFESELLRLYARSRVSPTIISPLAFGSMPVFGDLAGAPHLRIVFWRKAYLRGPLLYSQVPVILGFHDLVLTRQEISLFPTQP